MGGIEQRLVDAADQAVPQHRGHGDAGDRQTARHQRQGGPGRKRSGHRPRQGAAPGRRGDAAGRHQGDDGQRGGLHAAQFEIGVAIEGRHDDETAAQLDRVYAALPDWAPGKVRDPLQRVRNLLYISAVADIYRMDPLERFLPYAVFDQIQRAVPSDDLPKILYFIALHPSDGDDSASRRMAPFNLPDAPRDTRALRNRAMIYSFKFLARLSHNR